MDDRMTTNDGYQINEVQLYGGGPRDAADVVLRRRRQRDGGSLWSIMDRGACLDKEGDWVVEPLPSSRDDEFIRMCRWSTPDEAIAAWRQLKIPSRFCCEGQPR